VGSNPPPSATESLLCGFSARIGGIARVCCVCRFESVVLPHDFLFAVIQASTGIPPLFRRSYRGLLNKVAIGPREIVHKRRGAW
jgi:hypothetical protein